MDTLRLSETVLGFALRRVRSNCGKMPVTQFGLQPNGRVFLTNAEDASCVHPPAVTATSV